LGALCRGGEPSRIAIERRWEDRYVKVESKELA
jgi:hypothetical protein